ncbi:hypothetical protein [Engelhardtia mirabilis]|uniref:Uncharacterized protein n=1 Tax=Engelhardtia mirabilis TaxID=2528011 RepID=A0A518BQW5_9BACT|nr:hypothetical protein Pla133_44590 [Planctomycetes bacterium Pla133]QDV03666.1 hypothetical protein Pla86_44570 [Planctomycetes bacterium Pla86]
MPTLTDLIAVAIVAGICSSLALACFWSVGPEGRLPAATAASIASAIVVMHLRSRDASANPSRQTGE